MRITPIVLLLLISTGVFSQRQFTYFYGTIVDQSTQKPISGVNISFQGLQQGSVTDKKGEFSFFLDTIPVYMVISHMGYEKKKIWLDGTSPKLSIRLSLAVMELKEVEVVAKAGPEAFYQDDAYSVLDYEPDSNRVYILIYRFTLAASELICKTMDGKKLARSGEIGCKPDSLFRDCLRNVHLLCRDSSYQVYTDSSLIRLVYPTTPEKFRNLLNNCVASTASKLFFRKVTEDGFGIDFFRVDRMTSAKEKVASVVDEENLKRLRRNEDDYGRIRSSRIPDGRVEFQEWNFARKIMYRPRTASMAGIGENICIFNSADMTIEFYTPEGDFTSKLKLEFPPSNEGKWTKEIYIDEIRNQAYTSFNKGGEVAIYRMNLETGSLSKSSTLFYPYPQNIKVNGGKVFYMYSASGAAENKELFRQILK